eukprot:3186485-Pyramimonas_sp.AAC.1
MTNILELDVAARTYSSLELASASQPVLFSLDVAQAFPSLAQSFMFDVLRRLCLPPSLMAFLQ